MDQRNSNRLMFWLIISTFFVTVLSLYFSLSKPSSGNITTLNRIKIMEDLDSLENENLQELEWFKLILPVKNESKGYLLLKPKNNPTDTSEVSLVHIAALMSVLKEPGVRYNLDAACKCLLLESPVKTDSTNIQLP